MDEERGERLVRALEAISRHLATIARLHIEADERRAVLSAQIDLEIQAQRAGIG